MASCEAETAKVMEKKSTKIPSGVVELIDLAIYSFCSISGMKSNDKVRGGPVVLGVTAIFFQMLKVAKAVTQEEFKERFGDVSVEEPGSFEKAVCSRLKYAKEKTLNETGRADTPSSLIEIKENFDEATERVRSKRYPRCWRCRERCRCCLLRKKSKPIAPFGSELMSPFLSSLDDMASKKELSDSSDDDDEAHMPEGLENISDNEAEQLMEKFLKQDISDEEFNDQDSDDKEESSEDDEV